jgi:putative nucleotidyltransferase with HDIG domain
MNGKFSVRDIKDLPTLPTVASMALAVAEDPGSTARDLLSVILRDPPLTARILKVCNSVHFRRGLEITDLQTAIIHLGFHNVRTLILGISVMDSLSGLFTGTRFTREDFWSHCAGVAALSKLLAESKHEVSPSTAFVAGLLHDVGKIVLDHYWHDDFEAVLRLAEARELSFVQAEAVVLPTNHAALGGDLLECWGIPQELEAPVHWHHAPSLCPEPFRPTACVVQVADYFCNHEGVGFGGNAYPTLPSREVLEYVGLARDELSKLTRSLLEAGAPPLLL